MGKLIIKCLLILASLCISQKIVGQQILKNLSSVDSIEIVRKKILSLGFSDQQDRKLLDSLNIIGYKSKQNESNSFEFDFLTEKNHISAIRKRDEWRCKQILTIIDRYGWPGYKIFGIAASTCSFLIIQHSDLLTQKKILPILELAARKGDAEISHVALMNDRILVFEGKEQLYGTQIKIADNGKASVYPIYDSNNVNKRRALMNLGPIEEYLKQFDIEYP